MDNSVNLSSTVGQNRVPGKGKGDAAAEMLTEKTQPSGTGISGKTNDQLSYYLFLKKFHSDLRDTRYIFAL